jgi:hypothetical protein
MLPGDLLSFYGLRICLATSDPESLELFFYVGASIDASGFLLAAGGLLTASNSRSLKELDPQVLSRPEYRNFLLFLLLFYSFSAGYQESKPGDFIRIC